MADDAAEDKQWICSECYELGKPVYIHYGNWLTYIPILILILALIAIPSLAWLALITLLHMAGSIGGGFADISSMEPFPLARFIPEAPHTVKTCHHCNSVEHMFKITSRPGQDAMHWHLKKMRGGEMTGVDKQSKLS